MAEGAGWSSKLIGQRQKSLGTKLYPKKKYSTLSVDKRPRWDSSLYFGSHYQSKLYRKAKHCKINHVEVPCPDYTCFKASRYNVTGDKAVLGGEVVLLRKNYKPAPWCNPKIYTKPVRHCVKLCNGKREEVDVDMPNNYRHVLLNEKAMRSVQLQGENKARKAFIYVPVPPDPQQKPDKKDESNKNKKVFYESQLAKSFEKKPSQVLTYKKLDQYALFANESQFTQRYEKEKET